MDCGVKIGKFSDQAQKAAGVKYTANLLTHPSQYDLPFSRLNFLNGFENYTQAVTGNMTKDRKIQNKPGNAFSYRSIKQFMQLAGRRFINIATWADNKYLTTDFSLDRHFLSIFLGVQRNKNMVSRLR